MKLTININAPLSVDDVAKGLTDDIGILTLTGTIDPAQLAVIGSMEEPEIEFEGHLLLVDGINMKMIHNDGKFELSAEIDATQVDLAIV